jgi:hypothetical protein
MGVSGDRAFSKTRNDITASAGFARGAASIGTFQLKKVPLLRI